MSDSQPPMTRRSFLRRAAGWTALTTIVGGFTYARWVEPHWLEVVFRDLPVARLPAALVGRRLVQISDLHIGPQVDDDYLRGAFRTVADVQPDILAITGDFMTCIGDEQVNHVAGMLGDLRPGRLATVAILGNHDYGHDWSSGSVADKLAARLPDSGIKLLRDRAVDVQGLQIVGLDDLWSPCFEAQKVMSAVQHDRAALVLCHNPDAADSPIWSGYQGWILSGHTHGGQCRVPFGKAPLLPVANRRYVSGEVDLHDGRRLYINRALGHTRQVRFNVRPEITVFTLREGGDGRAE